MKKIIFGFATLALCFAVCTSCSNSNATQPVKTATPQSVSNKIAPKEVVVLNNDNVYRPGKKVKKLTIIDFNAVWCGPCKQFAPVFDKAAKKFGDKVDFISLDIDKLPETTKAFGVSAVPTVLFISPKGTVKTYVGTGDLLPYEKFEALVKASM